MLACLQQVGMKLTFSHGVVASSSMGLHESPGLQTTGRQGRVSSLWFMVTTGDLITQVCSPWRSVCPVALCTGQGFVEGPLPQGSGHILGHWERQGQEYYPRKPRNSAPSPSQAQGENSLLTCLLPSPISQSPLRSLGFQKATARRGEVGQFIFSHTEVGMGNLGRIT